MKRRITKYSFTKKITKIDGDRLFIELPKRYIKKANINREQDEFKVMKICEKEKQKQQQNTDGQI